jgi:hypothetical protein
MTYQTLFEQDARRNVHLEAARILSVHPNTWASIMDQTIEWVHHLGLCQNLCY